MRKYQVAGAALVVLGLLILFLLRDPLYTFIVVVIELLGIFIGIILVVVGIALLIGGRWVRRGAWGWQTTAIPAGTSLELRSYSAPLWMA